MTEDQNENGECVFCQIVKDQIQGYKFYEDDKTVAFLDLNPISKGHTLVIPKKHVANIHEAEGMSYMWDTIVKVSNSVREAFDPAGIKITQNNGEAAGQEMFHLHFHITPVYDGTEIEENYSREELEEAEEILDKIKEKMDEEDIEEIYG